MKNPGLIPQQSVRPLLVILIALFVFAAGYIVWPNVTSTTDAAEASCSGNTYVRGYSRSSGTYVRGHYRTCPDSSITNNYSYPGNYNPNTAKLYTDLGLMTCRKEYGEDVAALFNLLTGFCEFQGAGKLIASASA